MKLRAAATIAAVLLGTATVWPFAFLNPTSRWPAGSIVMHLQLGSSGTLAYGASGWNAVFEGALASWNPSMSGVSFQVIRDSTAPLGDGNDVNNVFFSSNAYDDPFGRNTLAVYAIERRDGRIALRPLTR